MDPTDLAPPVPQPKSTKKPKLVVPAQPKGQEYRGQVLKTMPDGRKIYQGQKTVPYPSGEGYMIVTDNFLRPVEDA